jgi:hypothetical protein
MVFASGDTRMMWTRALSRDPRNDWNAQVRWLPRKGAVCVFVAPPRRLFATS